MSLKDAWATFDKAVSFDNKANDDTRTEGFRRMSSKAREKNLDEAVRLEAEAIAAGERHE